jgi:hypothetical protein
MSTRGATGFVANGKWFVSYNHSDSYPEYLGMRVLEFCKKTKDWDEVKKNVLKVRLVTGNRKPSQKNIVDYLRYYGNPNADKDIVVDWYWLLHSLQGEGILYEIANGNLKHMVDDHLFLADNLFCEWAYIVDLDEMKLYVYKGLNEEFCPDTPLPSDIAKEAYKKSEGYTITELNSGKKIHYPETHYYPVKMLYAYDLYNLPEFILGVSNKFKEKYRDKGEM